MAENLTPQNRPDDQLSVDELENVAGGDGESIDSNGSQCFCSNSSCVSADDAVSS